MQGIKGGLRLSSAEVKPSAGGNIAKSKLVQIFEGKVP